MNTRMKLLRESLGLSQAAFAEALGVSQGTIWSWESGKQAPPEQSIRLICKTFGVNRKWLENNDGEMFELNLEDDRAHQRAFVAAVLEKLSDEQREIIAEAMREVVEKQRCAPQH